MRELIKTYVDECIDEMEVRTDVKDMLKKHERKSVLIDRLTHQMQLAEKATHKVKLDKEKIRSVVKDFVNFFFSLAKTEADAHSKTYHVNLMSEFNKKIQKDNSDDWNVKVQSL